MRPLWQSAKANIGENNKGREKHQKSPRHLKSGVVTPFQVVGHDPMGGRDLERVGGIHNRNLSKAETIHSSTRVHFCFVLPANEK